MGQFNSDLHTVNVYKVILASALVAAAASLPATPYAPQPYDEAPEPFTYEYGVADDYSGANFRKTESQDDYGNVAGSYTIALPDGRIQTTSYHADNDLGFVAEVSYEGTPSYPAAHAVHAPVAPAVHAPVVAHAVHAPVVAHAVHAPVVAHAPVAQAVHAAPIAHAVHAPVAHAVHAPVVAHHAVHAPVAHHAVH